VVIEVYCHYYPAAAAAVTVVTNWNFRIFLIHYLQPASIENVTRNRKHRRAAAKPAACAKPLML